jgi:hypothetical protein
MRLALLAVLVVTGCAAAEAKGPRFPDRLPKHTRVAYAHSYGGFVGGHAFVIVTTDGKARVKCRFADKTLHRHVNPHKWDRVLKRAHLDRVESDDPSTPPVESPELWILSEKRVTYRQAFAHKNGYPPRVQDVAEAFERYLSNVCPSPSSEPRATPRAPAGRAAAREALRGGLLKAPSAD